MTMPTPAVPVFVAGFAPTVTSMTAQVTQPFEFCANSVLTRVEQTSGQSISASTLTVVQFNSVLEDPYSAWQPGSFAFLAPFSGYYEVDLTVGVGTVNGTVACGFEISNTTQYTLTEIATPSTNQGYATASFIVPMIGGTDFVQGLVFTSASVTTSTSIQLRSCMDIKFISS